MTDPHLVSFEQTAPLSTGEVAEAITSKPTRPTTARYRAYACSAEDAALRARRLAKARRLQRASRLLLVGGFSACVALCAVAWLTGRGALFAVAAASLLVSVGASDLLAARAAKLATGRMPSRLEPPWSREPDAAAPSHPARVRGTVHVLTGGGIAVDDAWDEDGRYRVTRVYPFAIVERNGDVAVVRCRTAPRLLVPRECWTRSNETVATAGVPRDGATFRATLRDGESVTATGVFEKTIRGRTVTFPPACGGRSGIHLPLPPAGSADAARTRRVRFLGDGRGDHALTILVDRGDQPTTTAYRGAG